jgi:hypothetical protein
MLAMRNPPHIFQMYSLSITRNIQATSENIITESYVSNAKSYNYTKF